MHFFWFACAAPQSDLVVLEEDSLVEEYWAPDEKGPYDAGLHSFSFMGAHDRFLSVDVWYPARRQEIANRAEYEPFSFQGEAYRDAPLALKGTTLLVFSHGLMSVRFQNFTLFEHLAQHGYTIVATDHPGTTIFEITEELTAESVFVRPDDIQSTVDEFWKRVQDPASQIYELTASEQYIAVGHSLGSHTAMTLGGASYDYDFFMEFCREFPTDRACRVASNITQEQMLYYGQNDPRVYATIAMSPGLWYTFGDGLAGLRSPFFVTGQLDEVLEYETEAQPILERLPQASELYFPKTGHYGFTEMCAIIPAYSDECSDTTDRYSDSEQVREILKYFVLAHIRGNLEGNSDDKEWLLTQDWSSELVVYRGESN